MPDPSTLIQAGEDLDTPVAPPPPDGTDEDGDGCATCSHNEWVQGLGLQAKVICPKSPPREGCPWTFDRVSDDIHKKVRTSALHLLQHRYAPAGTVKTEAEMIVEVFLWAAAGEDELADSLAITHGIPRV